MSVATLEEGLRALAKPNNLARFVGSIEVNEVGCWLWNKPLVSEGYARFYWGHSMGILAHRLAYGFWVGSIPANRQIDHLCRVRHCVNPDHLEVVTSRENTMRGMSFSAVNARKTHCINGHPLNAAHVRIERRLDGVHRTCRPCQALFAREKRRNTHERV